MTEKQKNRTIERIAREMANQLIDEIGEIQFGSIVKKRISDKQDWRELMHDDACWMTCADLADTYQDEPTDETIRNDVVSMINAMRNGYGTLAEWMPED